MTHFIVMLAKREREEQSLYWDGWLNVNMYVIDVDDVRTLWDQKQAINWEIK